MDIAHVAALANLPLTPDLEAKLAQTTSQVLDLVNHIQQLDTSGVEPTSQVTGLVNVTRPDEVDPSRILTQAQALANAPATQDGYFKVPAIFS